MEHTDHRDERGSWDDLGRAAEDFARRVARDASRFAERIEEHAGVFARDLARDWRRARRRYRHACRYGAAPDARRIFDDIRTMLTDVLDGVDEFIERVFPGDAGDHGWVRVVANRDVACAACARTVHTGEDTYLHAAADGKEFRCLQCGPGASEPPPT
jgi:hypothetical protein